MSSILMKGLDPDKCRQRNRLALFAMFFQIVYRFLDYADLILKTPDTAIAAVTKKPPHLACDVVVVDAKGKPRDFGFAANLARPALRVQHSLILRQVNTKLPPQRPVSGLRLYSWVRSAAIQARMRYAPIKCLILGKSLVWEGTLAVCACPEPFLKSTSHPFGSTYRLNTSPMEPSGNSLLSHSIDVAYRRCRLPASVARRHIIEYLLRVSHTLNYISGSI